MRPRQRGLGHGIFHQDRRPPIAEARLDALDEDAGKNVGPAIVRRDAKAARDGLAGQGIAISAAVVRDGGQDVDTGEMPEGLGDSQPLRLRRGIGSQSPKREAPAAGRLCGERENLRAILHQAAIALLRPVPFEQGEFRVMGRCAFAIAEHLREIEDPPLSSRQQLLAGEFRRRMEIAAPGHEVGADEIGRKGVKMGFVAWRDLQDGALHLDELVVGKKCSQRGRDLVAGE